MEIMKIVWEGLSSLNFDFFGINITFSQIFVGFTVLIIGLKFLYSFFDN